MKTKLALSAIVAAVAVFSQSAFAQASSPTRAEVKAETRAAEKSGKLTPAGEATPKSPAPAATSTKTRAERKAETKMARDAGALRPAGEAPDLKAEKEEKARATGKDRAVRKAETKAAVKAGETTPAGEATPGVPKK